MAFQTARSCEHFTTWLTYVLHMGMIGATSMALQLFGRLAAVPALVINVGVGSARGGCGELVTIMILQADFRLELHITEFAGMLQYWCGARNGN